MLAMLVFLLIIAYDHFQPSWFSGHDKCAISFTLHTRFAPDEKKLLDYPILLYFLTFEH
jgi:hypothetical protein